MCSSEQVDIAMMDCAVSLLQTSMTMAANGDAGADEFSAEFSAEFYAHFLALLSSPAFSADLWLTPPPED